MCLIMFRFAVILCLLGVALATPSVVRTREEIEEYRNFLESSRNDDTPLSERQKANPKANTEELSGKFEGDIILDDFLIKQMVEEFATGHNAYIWPNTRWPHNTVIWEYGTDVFNDEQKAAIEAGIKDIEDNSCIKFRKREPEDAAFVSVTGLPSGCFAHVGFWAPRGVHTYNLAPNVPGVGCFRHVTIVHEWLHILGFFHMQSTYNRDEYVKIVEDNIRPGTAHNFDKRGPELVSNLGINYDFVSCMHYGPFAFSVNGEPTIIALQEHEGTMGQRVFITDKDWLRLNRHYECPGAWED